jgi:TolA-binding protein
VRGALLRSNAKWVALLLVVLVGSADLRADELGDLEKAYGAYAAHRYADAEARLRALLDPATGKLKDEDAIADARMYLAATLLAEGKPREAENVLERLLLDKPDYQADPLRIPLPALDALADARSQLRDKLNAIKEEKARKAQQEREKVETEKRKAAERLATLEQLANQEVVVERHSRILALLPFGVGQFQNGQTALGWSLLVGESALALGSGISAALTLNNAALANDELDLHHPTVAGQYNKRAQADAIAGNVFAGAFALAAVAGIIQAELAFVPEHTEVRRRPLPPLSLTPFAGPGSIGIKGCF